RARGSGEGGRGRGGGMPRSSRQASVSGAVSPSPSDFKPSQERTFSTPSPTRPQRSRQIVLPKPYGNDGINCWLRRGGTAYCEGAALGCFGALVFFPSFASPSFSFTVFGTNRPCTRPGLPLVPASMRARLVVRSTSRRSPFITFG